MTFDETMIAIAGMIGAWIGVWIANRILRRRL
jgi:uncharacterized membrane protein YfcA